MASSPHGASAWRVHESQAEYDLLVQEPPPPAYVPQFPHGYDTEPDDETPSESQGLPLDSYEQLQSFEADELPLEYASAPGIPGRGVIVVSMFAATLCAGTDLALTGGLSYFFDLCFIVVCLVAAMSVRRRDLFTAGVLPPLAFGVLIGAIALVAPHALAATGSTQQVFLTGLAEHAPGLVFGYAVALITVAGRVGAARRA